MPRVNAPLYALNGGEIGPDAINRLDLERLERASQLCENIFPTVVGRMDFRPGFEFIAPSVDNGGDVRLIPFVFDVNEQSILVFTESGMRILAADGYRPREAVGTTIQNGDFSDFTGWTDVSTGAGSASAVDGNLNLAGASGSTAIARQAVTVAAADQGSRHGIDIEVTRGPTTFRIGTTAGGDEVYRDAMLEEGSHSLAFTAPTGVDTIYVQFSNTAARLILVEQAVIAAAGLIQVSHPWNSAQLRSLQYTQSSDVIFVASQGQQQRRIERRDFDSWSIVRYKTFDGPFDIGPDTSITITPGALSGNTTLTASERLFEPEHVGSLIRLTHTSQRVETTFTGADQVGESIRVTGVTNARIFNVSIAVDDDWDGTITLEQSIGAEGNETAFLNFTTTANRSIDDELQNQIVFYRLRVLPGNYTAGSAIGTLSYFGGRASGIARITDYTSPTEVEIEILEPFGDTTGTSTWDFGTWSDLNGWPTSVAFHDGRLWWGREDLVFGSVSDAFNSYDDTTLGDSAPVIRSVGLGSQRGILWLQSLQRFIVGTDVAEVSIRASSFDEPLTASAFVPRDASTRGVAPLAPVKVDTTSIFVQRSRFRVFDLFYSVEANDYTSRDLTELHRNVCRPGVTAMAVQRQPDTRVWFVLSDGTARVLVYEPAEQVVGWCRVTIDGRIEDVISVPSEDEDAIYIATMRTVNGVPARNIERLALTGVPNGLIRQSDMYIHLQNVAADAAFTQLEHLEGEQVVVWADGQVLRSMDDMPTVLGGQVPNQRQEMYQNVIIGVPYIGRWQSVKLAYGAGLGTALTQYKRIDHVGITMLNTAPDGIRMGRDFDNLTRIATRYRNRPLVPGEILSEWDQDASQFNGGWSPDARVHLEMRSPYPVSVSSLVFNMKTNDRG